MLIAKFSQEFEDEKRWIINVIFTEFLGLPYEIQLCEIDNFTIEHDNKKLFIASSFFLCNRKNWLQISSLPILPLSLWRVKSTFKNIILFNNEVPVIYGRPGFYLDTNRSARLSLDVFGSAFFMLSRYEELVTQDVDGHERFPATASMAYKADFLDRPIVDEYTEILWECLKSLWPELKRKKREPQAIISCDVDDPYSKSVKNIKALPREVAVSLIKHKNIKLASSLIINSIASRIGIYRFEPYDTFNWIMESNEKSGNSVTFYFIADNTAGSIDGCYSLKEPRIRSLMKIIYDRGHKIGLHGSYNTYNNQKQMSREVKMLTATMNELGISQKKISCRQHYLRWETPDTAMILNNAGFDYDSTLGYADQPGFRCGTCHEYTMFDLVRREVLAIKQNPLIVMESSIISKRYMGLGYDSQSLELFLKYKNTCTKFNGNFTLLWHNSHFNNTKDKEFYKELIKL
jgi:hypothetical protein